MCTEHHVAGHFHPTMPCHVPPKRANTLTRLDSAEGKLGRAQFLALISNCRHITVNAMLIVMVFQ